MAARAANLPNTTPDSEILTLDTKAGDATGVRIYESSHEGRGDEMHQAVGNHPAWEKLRVLRRPR